MKIGITGANGFIGSHLLRFLIHEKHQTVAFLQKGSSLRSIEDLESTYTPVWGDLLEPRSLDRFVSQCDVVFHLAGYNRYWSESSDVFHQINYQGVENVLQSCMKCRISKLIHVSSCVTLGASDGPTVRSENSDFNLRQIPFLYAETKKAGEDLVSDWVRKKGFPAVVIHPTSAIGEKDFGPTPIGKPIYDICKGRWPVYVDGGACFIDVHDVVRGLWLALEKGRSGEKYLLAGNNLTNQEFMSTVARSAGIPAPKFKIPKPFLQTVARVGEWVSDHVTQKEPALTVGMTGLIGKYLYYSGEKAKIELGFEPAPVGPAIQRCVDWFKQTQEIAA